MTVEELDGCADFYFYDVGFNLVPVYDRSKTPKEKYERWMHEAMPPAIHEHYKRKHVYENIALINGLVHRGGKKGYYIWTVDCDSEKAIRQVCTVKGVEHTLEQMSQQGIWVQQHCKNRAHFIVLSEKPVPKLMPGNVLGMEIKSEGQLTILAGSRHADGKLYQFVGKKKPSSDDHGLTIHTEFIYHIKDILKKNGIWWWWW